MSSEHDALGGKPPTAAPDAAGGTPRFRPQAFGKYYLVDPVAVGGMAEVFLAKTFGASGFEKVQVVKRILDEYAADANFIEMFIDEAKLSVQLTHPNIVQIFDFGKIDLSYFIAMEAVDGKDLKSVLRRLAKRGEHMPVDMACIVAHQSAKGLHYAHERSDAVGLPLNIVHRDVSPSNLLISYEGQVKVADFGIADADSGAHATQAGVLKGKYSYMSPEQSLGAILDQRSDIFSLGICLWESLTGHRLFRRDNNLETLEAVRNAEIPAPSQYNPAVPPELDAICFKALERDIEGRYSTAAEFQRALGDFLLPETADRICPQLATWMHERFGEEIRRERERLERGTRIATALHSGNEVDFRSMDSSEEVLDLAYHETDLREETHGTKTVLPRTRSAPPPRIGLILGVVTAFSLGAAVLLFLIANLGTETTGSEPELARETPAAVVAEPDRTTASTAKPVATPASAEADTRSRTETKPDRPAPPPTTGVLRIRSKPAGAAVSIDGRKVGKTPINWKQALPGRSYSIDFSKAGYTPITKSAEGPAVGTGVVVSTTLEPVPKEPGKVNIQATPWAEVWIDGKNVGQTPIFGRELSPGTHTIRLVNSRLGVEKTDRITVRAGETTVKAYTFGQ
ncbi:MAG: serine/threonine-protein kinase [Myxococcota bacterium]|nr:serine/threonine-protein kinase [Myxococcota bacterium]